MFNTFCGVHYIFNVECRCTYVALQLWSFHWLLMKIKPKINNVVLFIVLSLDDACVCGVVETAWHSVMTWVCAVLVCILLQPLWRRFKMASVLWQTACLRCAPSTRAHSTARSTWVHRACTTLTMIFPRHAQVRVLIFPALCCVVCFLSTFTITITRYQVLLMLPVPLQYCMYSGTCVRVFLRVSELSWHVCMRWRCY